MSYTLFNKSNQKKLTHPKVGLWFTNDLEEAKEMLSSFYDYLDSSNMSSLKDDIAIFDVDQNKVLEESNELS
jgi:hypothetical protein